MGVTMCADHNQALLISGIMLYVILTSLERFEGSFYVILYIIEAVLAGYLVTFHISLRINPSWIFKNPEALRNRFYIMGAAILFLIAWIIFVVITYKI